MRTITSIIFYTGILISDLDNMRAKCFMIKKYVKA